MRGLPCFLGCLVVPFTYKALRSWSVSPIASLMVSFMILFENALLTQSRLILLDSFLLFFVCLSFYFWSKAENSSKKTLSLVGLGVSMGCALSSKWVGLFIFAPVGLSSVNYIWKSLGDRNVPLKDIMAGTILRLIYLTLIPAIVYIASFYVHFHVANQYSQEAASFSVPFQMSLKGHNFVPTSK